MSTITLTAEKTAIYDGDDEAEARDMLRAVLPATVDPRALAIASHGITLTLDETGDYPMMVVTSAAPIPGGIMVLCHAIAGEFGAGIIFEGAAR